MPDNKNELSIEEIAMELEKLKNERKVPDEEIEKLFSLPTKEKEYTENSDETDESTVFDSVDTAESEIEETEAEEDALAETDMDNEIEEQAETKEVSAGSIFDEIDEEEQETEKEAPFEDAQQEDSNTVSFKKEYENKKKEKELSQKTRIFKKSKKNKESSPDEDENKNDEVNEEEKALEEECQKSRQEKIEKFRLFTETLSDDLPYNEDEQESTAVKNVKPKKGEDIFAAIEKAIRPKKDNLKKELKKQRDSKVYEKIDVGRVKNVLSKKEHSIKTRLIVLLVSFALICVSEIIKNIYTGGGLGGLSYIMTQKSFIFYIISFVLCLPMLVISLEMMLAHNKNSYKFSLCNEVSLFVLSLCNVLHNVVMTITQKEITADTKLFSIAVCFALILSCLADKKENEMIRKNLETLTKNERLLGVFSLGEDIDRLAAGISNTDDPTVLCAGEVEIPNSFLDSSEIKDKQNRFFTFSVFGMLLIAVICGVIAYITYGSVSACSVSAMSALCICSPVFLSPALSRLLSSTNSRLNRIGCEILGYEAVEYIEDTDAIVLDTADIFDGEISSFHLISKESGIPVVHAFEIACSVLYKSQGILKNDVVDLMKEEKLVLPEVEDLKYEEKLGLSCWVEDKCVLLGNESMMKEHNITLPSENLGVNYLREGKKVFYLAVDSVPVAMFCAEYYIGRLAKKQLQTLYGAGVILMLMSSDPNIDEEFVANTLDVNASSIKIMGSTASSAIKESVQKTAKQKRTGLIFKSNIVGLLKVINCAFRLYDVQSLTMLIQVISMMFAFVITAVLNAVATGYFISGIYIIAYQLFWYVLTLFVTKRGSANL